MTDPHAPSSPGSPPQGPSGAARIAAPAIVLAVAAGAVGLGIRHYSRPDAPVAAAQAPAPGDPYAFRLEPLLVQLAVADRDTGPQFNQALAAFRNQGLDETHFMLKVSSEVLLPLQLARNTLKNLPPLPAPENGKVEAALTYANLRGEMWLLMARRALSTPTGQLIQPDEQDKLDKARAAAQLDGLTLPPPTPPEPPQAAPPPANPEGPPVTATPPQ